MHARVALLLAWGVLVAGCATPAATSEPPPEPAPAAPPLVEPSFRPPLRLGWGGTAAEPSVAVGPDGTIFVAAAPQLWRSRDGGSSFEALGEEVCASVRGTCLPGDMRATLAPLDGFGGDADIAVDASGALHYVGLNGETGTVPYQASRDGGATWSEPYDLAGGNAADRQWLDVLPDGTLVATWRDFGGHDDDPEQLLVRRSLDGGATWEPAVSVAPDALQGPLAHGPDGTLYFAFYEGGIRIARSDDRGATWSLHDAAPETRDTTMRGGRPIDMFPVAAVDDAGAVYVAWAADLPEEAPMGAKETTLSRVWLIVSTDRGATWTEPRALSPEGKVAALPWLVAGAPGRVALNWYASRAGTPSELAPDVWDVVVAQSVDASAAEPTFVLGLANADPVHVGAMCRSGGGCERICVEMCVDSRVCDVGLTCVGKDRSRLEFFELALDAQGHPVTAWVADARPPAAGIEIHFGGVADGTPLR